MDAEAPDAEATTSETPGVDTTTPEADAEMPDMPASHLLKFLPQRAFVGAGGRG